MIHFTNKTPKISLVCPELIKNNGLSNKHKADLLSSGIDPDLAYAAGFRTINATQTKKLTVNPNNDFPGLCFPYRDLDGCSYKTENGADWVRLKPDYPDNYQEERVKYKSIAGAGNRPYFSPFIEYALGHSAQDFFKGSRTDTPLFITEGEKKADCMTLNGYLALSFPGVYSWLDKRNGGESSPLPELNELDLVRHIYIVFDSDIITNSGVQAAAKELADYLEQVHKATVKLIILPTNADKSKNGVDDYIIKYGNKAFSDLVQHCAVPALVVVGKGDAAKRVLNIGEPTPHSKAIMVRGIFDLDWALRGGLGWYQFNGCYWKNQPFEVLNNLLHAFYDANKWNNIGVGILKSIVDKVSADLYVADHRWNTGDKVVMKNGTLRYNLDTGDIIDFQPEFFKEDYRTYQLDTPWIPNASCPLWLDTFIPHLTVNSEPLIKYIRSWLRFILTPVDRTQKFKTDYVSFFMGGAGIGKSTMFKILVAMIGEQNTMIIEPDSFDNPNALAALVDKVLAYNPDVDGYIKNLGIFNRVTSNESVQIKKLFKDVTDATLGVRVAFGGNEMFGYNARSKSVGGLHRRLQVVYLKAKAPEKKDPHLEERLRTEELAGIFQWVMGITASEATKYLTDAIDVVPELIAGSLAQIDSESTLLNFIEDTRFRQNEAGCADKIIEATVLFQEYLEWAQRSNQRQNKVLSQTGFGRDIKKMLPEECVTNSRKDGKGKTLYLIPDITTEFKLRVMGKKLPTHLVADPLVAEPLIDQVEVSLAAVVEPMAAVAVEPMAAVAVEPMAAVVDEDEESEEFKPITLRAFLHLFINSYIPSGFLARAIEEGTVKWEYGDDAESLMSALQKADQFEEYLTTYYELILGYTFYQLPEDDAFELGDIRYYLQQITQDALLVDARNWIERVGDCIKIIGDFAPTLYSRIKAKGKEVKVQIAETLKVSQMLFLNSDGDLYREAIALT